MQVWGTVSSEKANNYERGLKWGLSGLLGGVGSLPAWKPINLQTHHGPPWTPHCPSKSWIDFTQHSHIGSHMLQVCVPCCWNNWHAQKKKNTAECYLQCFGVVYDHAGAASQCCTLHCTFNKTNNSSLSHRLFMLKEKTPISQLMFISYGQYVVITWKTTC